MTLRRSSLPLALATLAAAALLVGLAYRRPVSYRIDVGGGDAAYVIGFQGRERGARWSGARSQIVFHNAGQIVPRGRLRVRLAGYRPEGVSLPVVSLTLNAQPLARFVATRRFEVRDFEVDVRQTGPRDWTLTLESETLLSSDGRALGVQVDWAELVPKEAPIVPPLPAGLFVPLTSLAVFALTRLRHTPVASFLVAVAVALLGALGVAFAREGVVALLPVVCAVALAAAAATLAFRAGVHEALASVLSAARRSPAAALGGFALALIGQTLLSLQAGLSAGLALLALGTAAVSSLQPADSLPVLRSDPGTSRRRGQIAIALLITALALFLRLHLLGTVPFAIFRDEARHGLVALRILMEPAFHPLFLGPPINQPIPYFVVLAGAFKAFGANIFALRTVSAVAGALAVPLLWRFTRELYGERVALLAAFGLAVSSWHVSISRFAVNYVVPTPFSLAAYLLLWRGLRRGQPLRCAIGGLLIGLAQYASHTAKSLLFVAGALVADEIVTRVLARDASGLRRLAAGLVAAAAVGLATLTPLLAYILHDPGGYLARPSQVAIWSEGNRLGEYLPARLGRNVVSYAAAFNVVGDSNGRHHLPGAPLVDPLSGVFFVLGVLSALRGLRVRESRFVLTWLAGGLMPGVVTVDAPSALRTVEAAPATYVLVALGAVALWERIGALRFRAGRGRSTTTMCAVLASILAYNTWIYFIKMYDSPAVWRRFAPIATSLGETVMGLLREGALGPGAVVYAPRAFLDDPDTKPVFNFLTQGQAELHPYEDLSGPSAGSGLLAVPNYSDLWRLVAAAEPRYEVDAMRAAKDDIRWRNELGRLLSRTAIVGASFPASDAPTFWCYRLEGPRGPASGTTAPELR